jgi:hypothetical protein
VEATFLKRSGSSARSLESIAEASTMGRSVACSLPLNRDARAVLVLDGEAARQVTDISTGNAHRAAERALTAGVAGGGGLQIMLLEKDILNPCFVCVPAVNDYRRAPLRELQCLRRY